MIGKKKLAAIRQELRRALAATGDDPIRWLDERMSAPEGQGTTVAGESEVLHSLRRVLEVPEKHKRPKGRIATGK